MANTRSNNVDNSQSTNGTTPTATAANANPAPAPSDSSAPATSNSGTDTTNDSTSTSSASTSTSAPANNRGDNPRGRGNARRGRGTTSNSSTNPLSIRNRRFNSPPPPPPPPPATAPSEDVPITSDGEHVAESFQQLNLDHGQSSTAQDTSTPSNPDEISLKDQNQMVISYIQQASLHIREAFTSDEMHKYYRIKDNTKTKLDINSHIDSLVQYCSTSGRYSMKEAYLTLMTTPYDSIDFSKEVSPFMVDIPVQRNKTNMIKSAY
ncbi:hypothetical protein WICANDRAFT_65910, partial [Wickerhamomyces anomalus NRRL Y-366-8]